MKDISSKGALILSMFAVLIVVLSGTASAQSGKAWFKPKTFAETLNQDKKTCITEGFTAPNQLTTCLIDAGWTLIDNAVYEKDNSQCLDKADQGPNEAVRQSYLACMLERGWDIETNTERELAKLTLEAKNICNVEEYRLYTEKSACLLKDITLEQLSDSTRIDEPQKKALMAYTKAVDDILTRVEDVQRQGGMLNKKMYEYDLTVFKPAIDSGRIGLFQGKLSWGEYNQKKRDAFTQRAIALKNATEEVAEYIKTPVK